jgi:hypothetical protein
LAKGATNVALHGGIVLEEVLCLPSMEWAGVLEHLLEVFWACASLVGLRSGGMVGRGYHLHPAALLVLVSPIAMSLGRGRVIAAIASAEATGDLGFVAEVGLDQLLTDGILGGNVQELPRCVQVLVAERVDERLVGHVTNEGIDDVSINDVGEFIVLLEEMLDVLLKGLIGPLPVVAEVP